jgi:uncharacterized Zn finger protein (UPF0148 family)
MKEVMEKVICAHCGWTGRRKTGQLVDCPKCGNGATFDITPNRAGDHFRDATEMLINNQPRKYDE